MNTNQKTIKNAKAVVRAKSRAAAVVKNRKPVDPFMDSGIPVSKAITSRADWLLALWAAERMGLSGDRASLYARNAVSAEEQDHIADRLFDDLKSLGLGITRAEIEWEHCKLTEVVRDYILSE